MLPIARISVGQSKGVPQCVNLERVLPHTTKAGSVHVVTCYNRRMLIHPTHLQSPPPERLYAMCIPFGWTIHRAVTCNTGIHHIHLR